MDGRPESAREPDIGESGRRPDLHSLVAEALDATGWTPERREAWTRDFLYAFCVESEEMAALDSEWRDGSDPADDPREMRAR